MTHIAALSKMVAAVALGCGVAAFLGMSGCAVGQDAQGRAILGFPAGWHPDADGLSVAAGTIGTLFGGPVGGAAAVSAVGAIGGLFGWRKTASDLKRERDQRLSAERERAELAGAERGWSEREQAAAVQAPLGGGVDVVRPRVADAGAAEAGVVTGDAILAEIRGLKRREGDSL